MPLIQDVEVPITKESAPTNRLENYRGIDVDSRYLGKHDLITHISGSSWIVEYFNQLVNKDDEVNSLNVHRPGFLQQYVRIRDMELMVSNPLQGSPDQETNTYQLDGQATLYPGVIPHVGDMFVADGGDGRALLFTITRVERKSIFKDTAFSIDYSTKQVLDKVFYEDLLGKSVKEVAYVRELIKYGQRALLTIDEYKVRDTLLELERHLTEDYFNQFYDQQEMTFLVPTEKRTYDPFIVRFMKAIVSSEQYRRMDKVRCIPTIVSGDTKLRTIWDGILERSDRLLTYSENKMSLFSRKSFRGTGLMGTVAYSSVDYLIYPGRYLKQHYGAKIVASQDNETEVSMAIQQSIQADYTVFAGVEKVIPDIHLLDTYVFSRQFYQRKVPLSLLEQMVMEFMEQKSINPKQLIQLIEISFGWDKMTMFYYHPILILLARVTAGEYR